MGIKDSEKLRQLKAQHKKLSAQIDTTDSMINDLNLEQRHRKERLAGIRQSIHLLQDKDVSVSDHALVRLIQRTETIDIEKLKTSILDKVKPVFAGNGKYPLGNGLRAVVKDSTVVTVEPTK